MKASEHGGRVPTFVGQWSFNNGGEVWAHDYFPTKEEAISEGRAYYGDEGFEVGQFAEIDVAGEDAYRVIERLTERVYEKCGDVAEDYLSHVEQEAIADLDAALDKLLAEWLSKHGLWPEYGAVVNIERIEPEQKASEE